MSTDDPLFLYHLVLNEPYHEPAAWSEDDRATIRRHAEFLDGLGRNGRLAFAGRTLYEPGHPDLFGIAVIRAPSLEAAEDMMAEDPSVIGGIQRASLHPYSMAIHHLSRFERELDGDS